MTDEALILYRLNELMTDLKAHTADEKTVWAEYKSEINQLQIDVQKLKLAVEHRLTKIEASSAIVAGLISLIVTGFVSWIVRHA